MLQSAVLGSGSPAIPEGDGPGWKNQGNHLGHVWANQGSLLRPSKQRAWDLGQMGISFWGQEVGGVGGVST